MDEFELIPDPKGFFLDVKYPDEPPRYTIDLIKMECSCLGFTIEQARADKDNRKAKYCKHLDEVQFQLRHAGIKLGRFKVKEAI